MVKLEAGNVLLKPSHRRQLLGSLKRSQRIGERLGGMDLTITVNRVGNQHEARAAIQNNTGSFSCRCRKRDWQNAVRDLVQQVVHRLHDRRIGIA